MQFKLMYCWTDSAWLCVFHFWICVTQGIKAPFENKAADPASSELGLPVSFFLSLFLSLSLSFSLFLSLSLSLFSGWSPGVQRPSEFTFLLGLLRPSLESALHFHPIERAPEASMNRASPVSGTLLAFFVNQEISASFSFYFHLSCQRCSSWGYPWILLGLDPGNQGNIACKDVRG